MKTTMKTLALGMAMSFMATSAGAEHLVPLTGGFSDAERESVLALHVAERTLLASLHAATASTGFKASTAQAYSLASRECVLTLANILHINPEADGTSLFAEYEASLRSTWVAEAVRRWGRCRDGIVSVRAQVIPAGARVLADNALVALALFDPSLPYATPLPVETPRCLGPHGVLRRAMWFVHRSAHYFHDAWDDAATELTVRPATALTRPASTVVYAKGSVAIDVLTSTMLIYAGVLHADPVPGASQRVADILKGLEWLTSQRLDFSTPFRFNEVTRDGLVPWTNEIAKRTKDLSKLTHASSRVADAWRHADTAAWDCMILNGEGIEQ